MISMSPITIMQTSETLTIALKISYQEISHSSLDEY
jgi:hypothetical protein